jgi:DNA-binding winged helix-turn-helix (wHTH) protein
LGDFLGTFRSVSFGLFTLDTESRQLLRGPDGESVHLSPKAYELLCVLVQARPRALAKSELHDRLWPSTFVSEATLASLIAELRDALGERGRETRFIRTVHGFGYAFAGEARDVGAPPVLRIANWVVFNGREQALNEGEHVIGRDQDAALTLNSPAVSRRHAKIVIVGDVATLDDLGSKNGTYLRGQRVSSPVELVDGDHIRIGRFEITFRSLSGEGSTETQAWGSRELDIADPDGKVLRLSSENKPGQPFGDWLDMRGILWRRRPEGGWTLADHAAEGSTEPSGSWGLNGLPFLDLTFDGVQNVSGTTYWRTSHLN